MAAAAPERVTRKCHCAFCGRHHVSIPEWPSNNETEMTDLIKASVKLLSSGWKIKIETRANGNREPTQFIVRPCCPSCALVR